MMHQEIKKSNIKVGKLFFLISLLSILVIGEIFYELSILNFVLFLIYIVVYIYLPGKIVFEMLKIENFNNMMKEVISFFLGIFLIIIQYYVFSFSNSLFLIKYFIPAILVTRLIYLLMKKKPIYIASKNNLLDTGTYIFMGINIFISALFTMFVFPKPTVVSNALINQDIAWHMGNVNILSTGSNIDSRVYGVKFLYHYFSDLFYAIAKYIFGFSAYELIVQFQFIVIGTLVTISTIAFFKTVFKEKSNLAYFATFALLYVPSFANGYYNNIFYHLFTNINAMALTFPVVLITLLTIKNSLEVKGSKQNILLMFILIFLLAGLKGPIALCILIALFALTIAMLIQSKSSFFWLKLLVFTTVSYAIIHFTLLSQGSELVEIKLDTAFDVITSTSLFPSGLAESDNTFLTRFTYMIPHFLHAVFFFSVPYLWSLVSNAYKLVSKQYISLFDQFSLIFSVLSLGAYYIIRHSGYSQMYFLFGALPILYYLGGKEIVKVLEKNDDKEFKIIFIVITSLFFIRPVLGTVDMISERIEQAQFNFENEQSNYFNSSISSLEYEGMMWLKNNTNSNDLLATNRHNEDNLFFLYSAFSDRNFYIEGSDYAKNSGLKLEEAKKMLEKNDLLFSPDYQNKYNLSKQLNLDYIVQYKKQHPIEVFTKESEFRKVFENNDISIFKVLK
ncbi:MAG: hypothetical protein ABS911_00785 [Carnobacterium sp.]|uniref:hypothetical protein n=1 Tax=Carnobacterium sp. TaxID=48221 RepID=UPI0033163F3D